MQLNARAAIGLNLPLLALVSLFIFSRFYYPFQLQTCHIYKGGVAYYLPSIAFPL
jgi:hypothetical protein